MQDIHIAPDGNIRSLQARETVVSSDFSIDANSTQCQFQIITDERELLDVAWMEPNTYTVPLFDKVEWGVKLPEEILNLINNWIENRDGSNSHPEALNPFDPEDIIVQARISYLNDNNEWSAEAIISGFYYHEFQVNTESDNHNDWDWQEQSNDYPFRIRFSPRVNYVHKVLIELIVDNQTILLSSEFQFNTSPNDESKGYIKLSPNEKYFWLDNNKVFFPVGINLQEVLWHCRCEQKENWYSNPSSVECVSCYINQNDPCCGLNPMDPDATNLKEACAKPAHHMKILQAMSDLAASGANAFKFTLWPHTHELEFEKLNDYYDRLQFAWEFDRLIEHAHDLNLKMDLCLQRQETFQYWGGGDRWDWPILNNAGGMDDLERGYCYSTDPTLGLNSPFDFFTSENAKTFFKKKLRYYIARWGYSSSIFLIELITEVNQTGGVSGSVEDGQNVTEFANQLRSSLLTHDNSMEYRQAIGDWQREMAAYIKSMDYGRHPIAAEYTGHPISFERCLEEEQDLSWASEEIDVIAESFYDESLNRFEKHADIDASICTWKSYTCESLNQNNAYDLIHKPVIHSEIGDLNPFSDHGRTTFIKDLWFPGFAGYSSAGFSWHDAFFRDRSDWSIFGVVTDYFNNSTFLQTQSIFPFYIPDYSLQNESDLSNDASETVEAIMMRDRFNSEIHGVIFNRTWNDVSTANYDFSNTQLNSSYFQNLNNNGLSVFQSITYDSDDALEIHDLPGCRSWVIDYYDGMTGAYISSGNDDVFLNLGKLKLRDHPELTLERPILLFHAYDNGDCISNSPTNDESNIEYRLPINQNSMVSEQNNGSNSVLGSLRFENSTVLSSSHANENYTKGQYEFINIYDCSGKLIFQRQYQSEKLHEIVAELSSGIYFIVLTSDLLGNSVLKYIKL